MKTYMKYGFVILYMTLVIAACNSNNPEKRMQDSIDAINDSIANDTGSFDISSQADTTIDTISGRDTSGLR